MSREKREFSGVFIPAHIWHDTELTPSQMKILGEIHSLDPYGKGCFAQNAHFAKILGCKEPAVSEHISNLISKNYVESRGQGVSRRLFYNRERWGFTEDEKKPSENPNEPSENPNEPSENPNEPSENPNHKYQRKKQSKTNENRDAIAEIIQYLNDSVGSDFKPERKDTVDHINARMKEGFTIADFKAVIDCKKAEWQADSYWSKFLRPRTLFAPTHMEDYLQDAKKWRSQGTTVANDKSGNIEPEERIKSRAELRVETVMRVINSKLNKEKLLLGVNDYELILEYSNQQPESERYAGLNYSGYLEKAKSLVSKSAPQSVVVEVAKKLAVASWLQSETWKTDHFRKLWKASNKMS